MENIVGTCDRCDRVVKLIEGKLTCDTCKCSKPLPKIKMDESTDTKQLLLD